MSLKIIQIAIPEKDVIPEMIHTFSPEENFMMLKIGSDCLREGRNAVAGLTQKELYKKIKEESKEQIDKMERDLCVQREMSRQMEEKIEKIYAEQVHKLTETVKGLRDKLANYESENESKIWTEIEKVKNTCKGEIEKKRETYDMLLNEKDRQNQLNRDAFEKASSLLMTKNNSAKGSEGEKTFHFYANTFKDFNGYEIVDKHTQGGEGDFHLHFAEFDVLVDAKNYKKKVPVTEREKIKNDLIKNEHIRFAWLVSLNTTIDKFDKSPIMYEWVNTNQCIVYINDLLSFEDPSKILRIAWFTCKELHKWTTEDNGVDISSELTTMREKQFAVKDKIKNIRKSIRELNTNVNTSKNIIQNMDDQLRDMLETETNEMSHSNFSLFDDWWSQKIEITNESNAFIVSTDVWLRFKNENKDCIKEFEITVEHFKQYIKTKIPMNSLNQISKGGAYEIKGVQWIPSLSSVAPISGNEKDKKLKKGKKEDIVVKTDVIPKKI